MSLQRRAPDVVFDIEAVRASKVSWQAKLINAFIPVSKGPVLQLVLRWEILAGDVMANFISHQFWFLLGCDLWGKGSPVCAESPPFA